MAPLVLMVIESPWHPICSFAGLPPLVSVFDVFLLDGGVVIRELLGIEDVPACDEPRVRSHVLQKRHERVHASLRIVELVPVQEPPNRDRLAREKAVIDKLMYQTVQLYPAPLGRWCEAPRLIDDAERGGVPDQALNLSRQRVPVISRQAPQPKVTPLAEQLVAHTPNIGLG
jgi:hypothetical protein